MTDTTDPKPSDGDESAIEFEIPPGEEDKWTKVTITAWDNARLPDGHEIGDLNANPGTYRLERIEDD